MFSQRPRGAVSPPALGPQAPRPPSPRTRTHDRHPLTRTQRAGGGIAGRGLCCSPGRVQGRAFPGTHHTSLWRPGRPSGEGSGLSHSAHPMPQAHTVRQLPRVATQGRGSKEMEAPTGSTGPGGPGTGVTGSTGMGVHGDGGPLGARRWGSTGMEAPTGNMGMGGTVMRGPLESW